MIGNRVSHSILFHPRRTVAGVEEGVLFAPRFAMDGLLPCVATDVGDAPQPDDPVMGVRVDINHTPCGVRASIRVTEDA